MHDRTLPFHSFCHNDRPWQAVSKEVRAGIFPPTLHAGIPGPTGPYPEGDSQHCQIHPWRRPNQDATGVSGALSGALILPWSLLPLLKAAILSNPEFRQIVADERPFKTSWLFLPGFTSQKLRNLFRYWAHSSTLSLPDVWRGINRFRLIREVERAMISQPSVRPSEWWYHTFFSVGTYGRSLRFSNLWIWCTYHEMD